MPQLQQIDTRPIYDENLANFGNSFLQELNKHSTGLKDEEAFSQIPGYETEEDPIKQLELLEKHRNKFSPEYLKERRTGVIDRAKLKREEGESAAKNKYYEAQAIKALREPAAKAAATTGFVEGTPPKANDPSFKLAAKKYEALSKEADIGEQTKRTVKDARNAVEKGGGDVGLQSWAGQYLPFLKSPETATLENSSIQLFKHFKTIFPRMTNVDVGLIEDVQPAWGKSKEANNAILDIYESGANVAIEKKRIANELWKDVNQGKIPPYEFESRLDEAYSQIEDEALEVIKENAKFIKDKVFERVEPGYTAVVDPTGKIKQIKTEKVPDALKKKWRLYGR